jgi:HSP20 family molecular chaperone IbpA
MTTRTIVFDSPFLLGFEHTRALIERAAKAAAESYPPYNVEQLAEDRLRITLAVAGFSPDQLHVTVENSQLVVAGRREAEGEREDGSGYLHRGAGVHADLRAGRRDAGGGRHPGARPFARGRGAAGA